MSTSLQREMCTPLRNKGTLKETQEGIMKMILFAYEWRQQPFTIIEHQEEEPTDIANSYGIAIYTAPIHTVVLASSEVTVLSSDFPNNKEWARNTTNLMSLERIKSCFKRGQGQGRQIGTTSYHLISQAQESKNIESKVESLVNEICIKNIAVNVASFVLSDHMKKGISWLNKEDSLLTGNMSKF
jgi:hypothetical protein